MAIEEPGMKILEYSKIFVAKKDTWFKRGTITVLIDDYRPDLNSGLFVGTRSPENGEESLDEEICGFEEFEPLKVTAPLR